MRFWTSLFLVVVAILLFADPGRVGLLRESVTRHVPSGWTRAYSIDVRRPSSLCAYEDDLRDVAVDPARSLTERLGAAELLRVATNLRDDCRGGACFERLFATLWDAARAAPEEPAFAAILIDALRMHRQAAQVADPSSLRGEEAIVARELIRLSRSADRDSGYPTLFAAEVAAEEGRAEVARDLLGDAAETPWVDPYLRRRVAAAHDYLTARGVPALTAREFLVEKAYAGGRSGHPSALERLALSFGRTDAGRVAEQPRIWMTTYLALHEVGMQLMRSAFLAEDAATLTEACDVYLAQIRGDLRDLEQLSRLRLPDAILQRLAAAGFTRAATRVAIERGEAAGMASAIERRSRRIELALHDTSQIDRVIALHSLLVPLAATLLAVALAAFLAVAKTARPKRVPASVTLFAGASMTPLLVTIYLGSYDVFPLRAPPGSSWIAALVDPHPSVYLLPLVALPVLIMPYMMRAETRRLAIVSRVVSGYCLTMAAVLLVVFALTSSYLLEMRERRMRALDERCLEAYLTEEQGVG